MAEIVGKNTPSSDVIRSYVERLERIDAEKKALSLDRAAVLAEAKSAGYTRLWLNVAEDESVKSLPWPLEAAAPVPRKKAA